MRPRSCDTMVALESATVSGQTLFAKNSDRPQDEAQPLALHDRESHPTGTILRCQFVQIPQAPVTWHHIGSRPHWCWGYEHGFNEHQVVIGNEGLHSKVKSDSPKLIGMELVRLGLERGRTAAEAVEVMTGLITEFGQGVFEGMPSAGQYDNGYLVADPGEAYIIETAGHEWAVLRVEQTAGISNVYSTRDNWERLSPGAVTVARQMGWSREADSRLDFGATFGHEWYLSDEAKKDRRLMRSCSMLELLAGRIEPQTIMALLSDHSRGDICDEPFQTEVRDGGCTICLHYTEGKEQSGNTAASLVAHLCADGSRLPIYWCSFYSPCLGIFLPIFSEGELPGFLQHGDETPSGESAWWQFHRLSRAARSTLGGVALVRDVWSGFQTRLFESAYQVASDASRRFHNGDPSVGGMLTDYMLRNVEEMRRLLSSLFSQLGQRDPEVSVAGMRT